MDPVRTEDVSIDAPPRSPWHGLRDFAISLLVIGAIALILSFLSATSAHAQADVKPIGVRVPMAVSAQS